MLNNTNWNNVVHNQTIIRLRYKESLLYWIVRWFAGHWSNAFGVLVWLHATFISLGQVQSLRRKIKANYRSNVHISKIEKQALCVRINQALLFHQLLLMIQRQSSCSLETLLYLDYIWNTDFDHSELNIPILGIQFDEYSK